MTPKRYSHNAALIQWAYLFEEVRPLQTSTCALFWRATVLTPFKILGPALIVGVFAFVAFVAIADTFAPDWAHTFPWSHTPERHEALSNENVDSALLWFLGVVVGALLVLVVGAWTGLWTFLHSFCLPVEIEGGLVQKGMCPATRCTGRLIVDEAGTSWVCRRCKGRFIPPAPA